MVGVLLGWKDNMARQSLGKRPHGEIRIKRNNHAQCFKKIFSDKNMLFHFVCMRVFPVYVYHLHAWYLRKPERNVILLHGKRERDRKTHMIEAFRNRDNGKRT